MACHRAVVEKKNEKLDIMEKDRKIFFSRGKRVLLIRNDARNPIKMVLMLYNDDFGSKITFF